VPFGIRMGSATEDLIREEGFSALPVGWAENAAPAVWQEPRTREGGRAGEQNTRSLRFEAPRDNGCHAAAFFPDLVCAFSDCIEDDGFVALALSLAANSCLTSAAMASVFTL
jgi:hypothetical protein